MTKWEKFQVQVYWLGVLVGVLVAILNSIEPRHMTGQWSDAYEVMLGELERLVEGCLTDEEIEKYIFKIEKSLIVDIKSIYKSYDDIDKSVYENIHISEKGFNDVSIAINENYKNVVSDDHRCFPVVNERNEIVGMISVMRNHENGMINVWPEVNFKMNKRYNDLLAEYPGQDLLICYLDGWIVTVISPDNKVHLIMSDNDSDSFYPDDYNYYELFYQGDCVINSNNFEGRE